MNGDIKQLQEDIGYIFKNESLLENALTHSSYANENSDSIGCNERLEFLGDSVLSVIVSKMLYETNKNLPEGELTRLRASFVCEQSLYAMAKALNLGIFLRLGRGETVADGNYRPSIMADALEALLAAIYLDGGIIPAEEFLLPQLDNAIENPDYKTMLQEKVQKEKGPTLEYIIVSQEGPEHQRMFVAEVLQDGKVLGRGTDKSKKAAQQQAAKQALCY